MNQSLLIAKNLTFSYLDTPLIEALNICVDAGKIKCIFGPNGAGKTSLILLLAGIIKPQKGTIQFNNKALHHYPRKALARELAYIPSEVEAPFAYTVYEFVEMGRYAHRHDFLPASALDKKAIIEALERTQLINFSKQLLNTLSSGEKQRAVIARSLAQQSRCLLMDEPTAHLDLRYQIEIYNLLRQLADDLGIAVLLISHDLNLATHFSDDIILMKAGKIVFTGTSNELMESQLLSQVYSIPLEIITIPKRNTKIIWPILPPKKTV